MKNTIKKIPIPLCGVMLGLAALGNLLQNYSEGIRYICGILAAFLLILVLLKLIMFPQMVREDMKNPIMASVSGTFPMALMLLSVYVKPFIGKAAYFIWLLAICLHIILIIYFTVKFLLKLQMPKVFASYFIVYVGIVVASVTAPAYEKAASIGRNSSILVWFCHTDPASDSDNLQIRKIQRSTRSRKTAHLHLRSTDKSLYCRICTVSNAEVIWLSYRNAGSSNRNLYFFTGKGNYISENAVLPKLCCIYIPICNQCNCIQTDYGMRCKHGKTSSVFKICSAD